MVDSYLEEFLHLGKQTMRLANRKSLKLSPFEKVVIEKQRSVPIMNRVIWYKETSIQNFITQFF